MGSCGWSFFDCQFFRGIARFLRGQLLPRSVLPRWFGGWPMAGVCPLVFHFSGVSGGSVLLFSWCDCVCREFVLGSGCSGCLRPVAFSNLQIATCSCCVPHQAPQQSSFVLGLVVVLCFVGWFVWFGVFGLSGGCDRPQPRSVFGRTLFLAACGFQVFPAV